MPRPTRRNAGLMHVGRGVVVPAVVLRDVPPTRLARIEQSWQRFGRIGPSSHWNWVNKIATVQLGHHRLIGVTCGRRTQGLMAVLSHPEPSVAGSALVYVDYLEVAPWNLTHTPRYTGSGTLLLSEAVRLSWEAGCGGAIGLHALPTAIGFYRQTGMTDHGLQPYHAVSLLPYFEFTPARAADWYQRKGFGTWPP